MKPLETRRGCSPPYLRTLGLSLAVAVLTSALVVAGAVFGQPDQSDRNPPEPSGIRVSAEAHDLAARKWGPGSSEQSLAVIGSRAESPESRRLVLEKIQSKRRELAPDVSRQLLSLSLELAKDPAEEPRLSAAALRTASSVARFTEEVGRISRTDVKRDFGFLTALAGDTDRDTELRGAAIRAIGDLKLDEASALLRSILADPAQRELPAIARNALLSIRRLEEESAFDVISEVMRRTENPAIFGTAAYSLGQIRTAESMARLVQLEDRFPDSGSVDAVLVDMEDVILDVFGDPNDANVVDAIEATRHLWRDGQRARYILALRSLLTTAPVIARRTCAQRLIEAASLLDLESEKEELKAIQGAISEQPELKDYADQIRSRLTAEMIVPTTSGPSRPVVLKPGQ